MEKTEIASADLQSVVACRGYPWWLLDMVNSVMTGRARSTTGCVALVVRSDPGVGLWIVRSC